MRHARIVEFRADTIPKKRRQPIFFHFLPKRSGLFHHDRLVFRVLLKEQPDKDLVQIGLLRTHKDRQHPHIQFTFPGVWRDMALEAGRTFLGGEKFFSQGQVGTQGRGFQSKLTQKDGSGIGTESTGIQADVQQPVLLRRGRDLRGIEQEPLPGLFQFQHDFELQIPDFVPPNQGNSVRFQRQLGQDLRKFSLLVIPENNGAVIGKKREQGSFNSVDTHGDCLPFLKRNDAPGGVIVHRGWKGNPQPPAFIPCREQEPPAWSARHGSAGSGRGWCRCPPVRPYPGHPAPCCNGRSGGGCVLTALFPGRN